MRRSLSSITVLLAVWITPLAAQHLGFSVVAGSLSAEDTAPGSPAVPAVSPASEPATSPATQPATAAPLASPAAQPASPGAQPPTPAPPPVTDFAPQLEPAFEAHRFLDRRNVRLHLFNVAAQTLDFYTTHRFLAEHTGVERNPFARLFVTHGVAGQIAYSYGWDVSATLLTAYWLHRHNHHRLERWTPLLVALPTLACGAQNFRFLR